jgi:hypothetical protein
MITKLSQLPLFSDKNFTITGPTAALNLIETHTEITCIGADGICSAFRRMVREDMNMKYL